MGRPTRWFPKAGSDAFEAEMDAAAAKDALCSALAKPKN
jgi:hypothetical protein